MQSAIILIKGLLRRFLPAIALTACISGCSKQKLPSDVMTQEQFASVLIDVYIAEAKLTPLRIPKDSSLVLFEPWEEKLLERKKISKKKLKETYRWYLDHPSDFERVYEIVTDTLVLREQRALHVKTIPPPPPQK